MKSCLGIIIGNRGVFPGYLAEDARNDILDVFKSLDIEPVIIPASETKFGAIENLEEARKCAELFKQNRERINGILVLLPNFGDERAVADTIRMSELNVPVLIQAYPDELDKLAVGKRRDSFCGKLSVCNNLTQYGIPFSLTTFHTSHPKSDHFISDLKWFISVCRVVNGLKGLKIGAIGARTTPFKTVRFSEKLLELSGISVETVDLSEIIGRAERLSDSDADVQEKLKAINSYAPTQDVPAPKILKMAKLFVSIDRWIKENGIRASTVRCWPELQEYYEVMPCYIMSMMSESLLPCACEVDVMGALAMYMLQLASEGPAGLFDWNNNYGNDPDKLILFHCSNYPKSMLQDPRMSYNDIDANVRGSVERSYGTCVGNLRPGPITFARVATNDIEGSIVGYVGEGYITEEHVNSFGGVGVAKINNLQGLLKFLCKSGFEHHVAISYSQVASALFEAMNTYLGWDIYYHE